MTREDKLRTGCLNEEADPVRTWAILNCCPSHQSTLPFDDKRLVAVMCDVQEEDLLQSGQRITDAWMLGIDDRGRLNRGERKNDEVAGTFLSIMNEDVGPQSPPIALTESR